MPAVLDPELNDIAGKLKSAFSLNGGSAPQSTIAVAPSTTPAAKLPVHLQDAASAIGTHFLMNGNLAIPNANSTAPFGSSMSTEQADVQALRKKVIDNMPLTPLAQGIMNNETVLDHAPTDPGTSGQTMILSEENPFLGPNYTRVRSADINLPQDQITLAHEMFHTVFQKSQIPPADFNAAWEAAKNDPKDPNSAVLKQIDANFQAPQNAAAYKTGDGKTGENVDTNPYDLATERFAAAGSMLGLDGLSAIPKALQAYYKSYIGNWAPPTFTADASIWPLTPEYKATLQKEAPETLKPPTPGQFATNDYYQRALDQYTQMGYWATEETPQHPEQLSGIKKTLFDFVSGLVEKNPVVQFASQVQVKGFAQAVTDVFTSTEGRDLLGMYVPTLTSDEINNIITRRQQLINSGVPSKDATIQAATETRKKIRDDSVANVAAGIIPEGGAVKKVVQKAAGDAAGAIERGFITSVKTLYPEVTKVAGQYIPRSTDALAVAARKLITESPAEAEKLALTGTSDAAVATASELIKMYGDAAANAENTAIKAGLEDKMAQIANTIAPKLTELGRSVQAASLLSRLTPEGQVRLAAQEIAKYNEMIRTTKGGPLGLAKEIPELTGEMAGKIADKMRDIQQIADPSQAAIALKGLQDEIQNLVPSPFMKKAIGIWKAGLLTGIKTSGLNIFANVFHGVQEIAKDAPAAAIDKIASLFTGVRTKTFTVSGEGDGLAEGISKGWQYLKTGFDERNAMAKYDYKNVNFGQSAIARGLQKYEETIFRIMGAEDQPFYYGAKARSLVDQAKAQAKNLELTGEDAVNFVKDLIKNPTDEMLKYASIDAETATFNNKTGLGTAAHAIQKIPGGVGEIIVPFAKTPAAVMMQVINYSPVGIVKAIVENLGQKFDQRLFSQALARGLTGTGIMYIGAEMFKKGIVTLDYPTDPREQDLWQAEGRVPNSILVGGKYRSVQTLGPAGMTLLIGAHFQDGLSKSGTITGALAQSAIGGIKSFTEQTFLQGIRNFSDALNDPGRLAEAYFGNLLGSAVPTIVNDVARATDTSERKSRSILERVEARIPFLREQLQPKVNAFGQIDQRGGNFLETMADPTRPSNATNDPVIGEMRRLATAGFKVSPTVLGTNDGYSSITPAQNTQLLKATGQLIYQKLTNVMQSKQYQSLPDDQKSKAVESFVTKAKVVARASMVLEVTQGLSGSELKNKLIELKASGLMTRDVFNAYQDLR